MEMTTTDLSKFGSDDLRKARELLKQYASHPIQWGEKSEFIAQGVQIMKNLNSGCVFLANSKFQVLMLDNEILEMFYTSPDEGRKGFYRELRDKYSDMSDDDKEWFDSLQPL